MRVIRGTNVYPSAVEGVVRRYPEIREFRIVLTRVQNLDEITVEIEPNVGVEPAVVDGLRALLAAALADAHEGLRFGVEVVAVGTLPVFELKARRLLDRRADASS
jgi:phenylacetate-CoA ligase